MEFPGIAWFQRLREILNADEEFRRRARHFTATFLLEIGEAAFTVDVVRGEMVAIHPGRVMTGHDFALAGPLEEWCRLVDGDIDLARATNPFHGRLRITGNVVAAAGNMWALYGLCSRFASVRNGDGTA